eukprot:jgi/Mesvir1/11626/Mv00029-RA.1
MAKPKPKKPVREADSGCQQVTPIISAGAPRIHVPSMPLHADVTVTGAGGQTDSSVVRVWLSPADMVTLGISADGLIGVSILERRRPSVPPPSPSATAGQGPSPGAAHAAHTPTHPSASKTRARPPSPGASNKSTPAAPFSFETPGKPVSSGLGRSQELGHPMLQRLWCAPARIDGEDVPAGCAAQMAMRGMGDGGACPPRRHRLGEWIAVALAWPAPWLQRGTAKLSPALSASLGGPMDNADANSFASEPLRLRLFPLRSAPCWSAPPAHVPSLAGTLVTDASSSPPRASASASRDTAGGPLSTAPVDMTPPRVITASEHTRDYGGAVTEGELSALPGRHAAHPPRTSSDKASSGGQPPLTPAVVAMTRNEGDAVIAVAHDCVASVTLRLCSLGGAAPTGSPQVVGGASPSASLLPTPPALPLAAPQTHPPQREEPGGSDASTEVPASSTAAASSSHPASSAPVSAWVPSSPAATAWSSPFPVPSSLTASTPICAPPGTPGPGADADGAGGSATSGVVAGTPSGVRPLPPPTAPSPATPAVKAWTPQASRLPGSASSLSSTPGRPLDRGGSAGSPAVSAHDSSTPGAAGGSLFGDALPRLATPAHAGAGGGLGDASKGLAEGGGEAPPGAPLGLAIVQMLDEGGRTGDAAGSQGGSGGAKGMLELFAAHWLRARHLVDGALVRIPLLGRWCIFCADAFELSSGSCSARTASAAATRTLAGAERQMDDGDPSGFPVTAPYSSEPLEGASERATEHFLWLPAHIYKLSPSTKVRLTVDPSLARVLGHKGGVSEEGADASSSHGTNSVVKAASGPLDRAAAHGLSVGGAGSKDGVLPRGTSHSVGAVDFDQLGGVGELRRALREAVELPLTRPELLRRYGIVPPKGVLLYGPPGTGKTSLVQALAKSARASFFTVNGPELVSAFYGESEASLRAVFARAVAAQPSIIFLDEIDAVATRRDEDGEEMSARLVATLLTLMDGYGGEGSLTAGTRVVVLASTNRPEALDPALRRPGRFDLELEVGVPTPAARREILRAHLSRVRHNLSPSEVERLASATHGFVGADLAALVGEASMNALRRIASSPTLTSSSSSSTSSSSFASSSSSSAAAAVASAPAPLTPGTALADLGVSSIHARGMGPGMPPPASWQVTFRDFERAQTVVRPSAMREVMLEVPSVRWSDIGGQEDIKQRLQEIVEWPQRHPEAFQQVGVTPPRGVLLYGPPGCSKTLLARAVASEAGLNFIAIKGPEIFSKWVGESEKAIQKLFARARTSAPAIIFFDEIDGLGTARDDGQAGGHGGGSEVAERVMSQLLSEMDGLASKARVVVVAATNRPDIIDTALLRPGRLDRLLYVAPPDVAARQQILSIHLGRTPLADDVSMQDLAVRTEGYTGADIGGMCRDACMAALEEDLHMQNVHQRHFEAAIKRMQPSRQTFNEEFYAKFQRGGRAPSRKP